MKEKIRNYLKIKYKSQISFKSNKETGGIHYSTIINDETYLIFIDKVDKKVDNKIIKGYGADIAMYKKQNPKNKNITCLYFIENKKQDLKSCAIMYLKSEMCQLKLINIDLELKEIKMNEEEIKKEKGNQYEIKIGKIVEKKDFIIKYNGLENGKNDHSIDVIAIKKGLILLIQCKNWSVQYCEKSGFLTDINFKSFIGQCADFVNANKVYQDFEIHKYWFVSDIKTVDKKGIDYANNVKHEHNFYLSEIKS